MFNQSFLKLRIMNIIQTELQTSVDVSQEIFVFFYQEGSCNEVKIYQMEFQTFQQKYKKKSKASIIKTKNYRTCGTNQNIENPTALFLDNDKKLYYEKNPTILSKKNNECNSVLQNQILSRLFCVTMNVYALFNFLYLKNSLKSNF